MNQVSRDCPPLLFVWLPATYDVHGVIHLIHLGRGNSWEIQQIIEEVQRLGIPRICITGGEPLLQAGVYPLMKELCECGFQLSIETGGSLPTAHIDPRVVIILDIKCPGSGMSHKNHWANLLMCALKMK